MYKKLRNNPTNSKSSVVINCLYKIEINNKIKENLQ